MPETQLCEQHKARLSLIQPPPQSCSGGISCMLPTPSDVLAQPGWPPAGLSPTPTTAEPCLSPSSPRWGHLTRRWEGPPATCLLLLALLQLWAKQPRCLLGWLSLGADALSVTRQATSFVGATYCLSVRMQIRFNKVQQRKIQSPAVGRG